MKHASGSRVNLLTRHALVVAAVVLSVGSPPVLRAGKARQVWFTPAAGSTDLLRLFQSPDAWAEARARMSVFEFYEGPLIDLQPDSVYLPNNYEALRSIGAFRTLTGQWHKRIAIEVGAVKPAYCTPDASGMRFALSQTLEAIGRIAAASGRVTDLSMDEPFLTGLTDPGCGAPDAAPTLARLEQYMRILRAVEPRLSIGLIEPYPFFSASRIEGFIESMRARGIAPSFFHADVDLNALENNGNYASYDVAADMRRLKAICEQQGIRFGFLFWGRDTDSDAVYVADALRKVQLAKTIFGSWDDMPDDLVFQSFAQSANGARNVPDNLPAQAPDTHTNLLENGLALLRGLPITGTAVPRR